ncbi:MAG: MoaD/ThiS family protein [SAR202 cluster bacterium]|nr:MoaD/ThiS family protein [SAR202 cluster bacterium]
MNINIGATVKDLIDEVSKIHPKLTKDFSSLVVAVNWEYSDFNLVLKENDEVALIPPVSGGM